MKNNKKTTLTDKFRHAKASASATALLALSGCSTIPWDGNPGHGEERIDEPLLTPHIITIDDVHISPAPTTAGKSLLISIDKFLNGRDDFTVRKIEFTGHNGTPREAYLSLPEEGKEGPYPMVVVFPVLSNGHIISEILSKELTRAGYATLRAEGYKLELDKIDSVQAAMDRFRHTILDARALTDLVSEFPEIDEDKIAVAGISLGGIMSATMMGVDPDIGAGAFIMGGGGLSEILHDSEQKSLESFREEIFTAGILALTGGSSALSGAIIGSEMVNTEAMDDTTIAELRERLIEIHKIKTREEFIAFTEPYTNPLDPSRYAGSLDPCRTMVLSATRDDIIPEERTKELWERLGKPEWNKVLAGHYSFALYFYWATDKTIQLFDRVLKDGVCEEPKRSQIYGPQPH